MYLHSPYQIGPCSVGYFAVVKSRRNRTGRTYYLTLESTYFSTAHWSREAVLSRHTSTALSMAAAFASASAPGIFAPYLLSNECAHKNHKCQIPNHSAQVISLSCFKCQASICNHENDADKLYNDSEDIKHFTPSHDKSCFRRFYLFFFLSLEILWTRFC